MNWEVELKLNNRRSLLELWKIRSAIHQHQGEYETQGDTPGCIKGIRKAICFIPFLVHESRTSIFSHYNFVAALVTILLKYVWNNTRVGRVSFLSFVTWGVRVGLFMQRGLPGAGGRVDLCCISFLYFSLFFPFILFISWFFFHFINAMHFIKA